MKRLSFIAGLCFTLFTYAEPSQNEVRKAIIGFNEVADHGTDPLLNCKQERFPPDQVSFQKGDDTKELYKKVDLDLPGELPLGSYEGDELTILTKEQADRLFKAFSEVEYMKFDYLHAGCEVRAHEFALMAKANGIEMGKAMTMYGDEIGSGGLYPQEWKDLKKNNKKTQIPVPDGFIGWRYHVAPYLLVKDGDEIRPYVFDIGVAKKTKTLGDWRKSLINATTEETNTFVRDRGHLHPDDKNPRREEVSYIGTELNKQELIREMGIYEFEYWDQKGLLSY